HHGAVHGSAVDGERFLREARAALPDIDAELAGWFQRMEDHLRRGAAVATLAEAMGLVRGVSGYIYHTVLLSRYAWVRWPGDFRRAVEEVIVLGGDADTTGAVTGAVAGATVGASGIPPEWLALSEWPRSSTWMRSLAARLAETFPASGA